MKKYFISIKISLIIDFFKQLGFRKGRLMMTFFFFKSISNGWKKKLYHHKPALSRSLLNTSVRRRKPFFQNTFFLSYYHVNN